jgi:acylphosphatase
MFHGGNDFVNPRAQKFIAEPARVWLYFRGQTDGVGHFPPGKRFLWHFDMAVNRKRLHIFYSGNVQGVGFRYTVKAAATGFEVTGWVRNLPDGRVELAAEGLKDELEAFRLAIREAGLEHFVRKEEISWNEPANEFRGFEIVRYQ